MSTQSGAQEPDDREQDQSEINTIIGLVDLLAGVQGGGAPTDKDLARRTVAYVKTLLKDAPSKLALEARPEELTDVLAAKIFNKMTAGASPPFVVDRQPGKPLQRAANVATGLITGAAIGQLTAGEPQLRKLARAVAAAVVYGPHASLSGAQTYSQVLQTAINLGSQSPSNQIAENLQTMHASLNDLLLLGELLKVRDAGRDPRAVLGARAAMAGAAIGAAAYGLKKAAQ